MRKAQGVFELTQIVGSADQHIGIGADSQSAFAVEKDRRRKRCRPPHVRLGDRADACHSPACRNASCLILIRLRCVDQAPTSVNRGVVEKPSTGLSPDEATEIGHAQRENRRPLVASACGNTKFDRGYASARHGDPHVLCPAIRQQRLAGHEASNRSSRSLRVQCQRKTGTEAAAPVMKVGTKHGIGVSPRRVSVRWSCLPNNRSHGFRLASDVVHCLSKRIGERLDISTGESRPAASSERTFPAIGPGPKP